MILTDRGHISTAETRLKDFRWKIPKQTTGVKPLDYRLGDFFQQAFELVESGIETLQEVVTLLTSEGGLLRIHELLDYPFSSLNPPQLARVMDKLLLPFLKTFTHARVLGSILLRARVITVYNVLYASDGTGERAKSLFALLATHLLNNAIIPANDLDRENASKDDRERMEAIDTVLAALAMLVDVNTAAQTDTGFVAIADAFAALINGIPESMDYQMRSARKSLERLQQRLGVGQNIPDSNHTLSQVGPCAAFKLACDMPGELSEQGSRHDNDFVNISDISVLPTLQEIQSPRNEYLPVANPREWHFGGIRGLVDRHFRLLREDTVGQIREAAKIELERLQDPDRQADGSGLKRQSARTHVYHDVEIITAEFDEYHGAQVVMRFPQVQVKRQRNSTSGKEWWSTSRRLGADALICLLSSEGSATFFVVAPQGKKPTRLQADFDLFSDPDHAYVVAKPMNHFDLHSLLSQALAENLSVQRSLVEFPGILLPAFKPTLKAMQRMSENLDMPFPNILAPASTTYAGGRESDISQPTYATKPGFRFDLSSITHNNTPLSFIPGQNIARAADRLAERSTLDLGQAVAVVSCLERSFAIVQGPPGTGKSFTGRSIDDGVENIVRIGGQSKSERVKDVNLRVLAMQLDLTKTEKSTRWELTRMVEEETAEIDALLRAFTSIYTQPAVESHLYQYHPTYHQQLFGSVDDEGYLLVRRRKDTILDSWLRTSFPASWRPRELTDLCEVNLHHMSMVERWVVFNSWIAEMKNELDEKLHHALTSYDEIKKRLDNITSELNLRVLQQANIIGVTTSGLARNLELLCGVNAKLLICEEAGEVLEAHMLTALLPSLEHCILIGDHQQLRPQVQNFDLSSESRSGGQYSLDVSLFERLVKPQDLVAEPLPLSTLEVQRRMHPAISQLVRETQYPSLKNDLSVSSYPEVIGMRRRLFWMHHEELEDDKSDGDLTSRTNSFEVDMVTSLVKHLTQQGVYTPTDIAVLTPYLGQLRKLRKRLSSTHSILLNDRDVDELAKDVTGDVDDSISHLGSEQTTLIKGTLSQAIRLATVDNFQGEEAKVVIVSLVRSNLKKNPGFLKTPNRINVLLSRAQHGMYIFGNMNTTESVPMWHDVMEILRRDDNIGEELELCCSRHQDAPMFVRTPFDFVRLSPEAGCDALCDKQLQCGHACVAKCHSDMLHRAVYCMKPCMKLKDGCEHVCAKPCGAQCDPHCMFVIDNIEFELKCGHVRTTLACFEQQDPSTVVCTELVKRVVPGCNHEITVSCYVNVEEDTFKCTATCGQTLYCGHNCSRLCHQCRDLEKEKNEKGHGPCLQKCDRAYSTCCHRCKSTCHEEEPCPPCLTNCSTRCPHSRCGKMCSEACTPCMEEQCNSGIGCPHNQPCIMPCAAPCTWIPCSERCDRILSCGCRCPSVCGEECPEIKYCQRHASDQVKGMQADLLMFKPYKDIDLDTDPCIFTSCGHVFTIDSLDGTMGMQDHYQVDPLTGRYTGLKTSAAPFSNNDSKPCPECRGSLRNLARYGRIVRRAMLDESAKKLTTWSNRRHEDLATRLANFEGELMGSADLPRKVNQIIILVGSIESQMMNIKRLKTTKRYGRMYTLMAEITEFARKVSKDEQPYQVVHDLVEVARRRATPAPISKFDFNSTEIQLRDHLQASNLLSRSYLILLGDIIRVHEKTPAGNRGSLHVDFLENRFLCEKVITEAVESKSICQEAEARVHWAKFAAMECGTIEAMEEVDDSELLQKLHVLREGAKTHLNIVVSICTQRAVTTTTKRILTPFERTDERDDMPQDPMNIFIDEAAEVRRMLSESLASSEMGMVVRAMAKEFRGIGHWYRCANGHPFTVGECGMPMELARCPECDSGVGGQSHRPTEGVTRAADIEERLIGMQL
ncbi:AAA domain-containing protein [Paraphoma chrysanthemicola]|uniref:AAA domain-containing protein n=1 Tax=Paraphoma chrysanthemicola TaxID=798071 RepID=A0A8K0RA70_9PLEO|nr:AAA domain-containing protein [Paraphoma chrysanthemicola]